MVSAKDRIFLSFAQADEAEVPDVLDRLRTEGLLNDSEPRSARDDIVSGQDVRKAIHDLVESASEVIVLWSKAAARSANVNYEIGMADALEKPILLVSLDEQAHPPVDLANVRVIDLHATT